MPPDDPAAADLPSQRGETWNDTEAINRHRAMTPSQRVALAIEVSRAALRFAEAGRRAGLGRGRSANVGPEPPDRRVDEQSGVPLDPALELGDRDEDELA
jgi:hypothetical protein